MKAITLSEVLKARGYVHQFSAEKLETVTDTPRTLYFGVDPTADSMHVGQLMCMLILRRFLEHGHKIILLAGGGTGMIGDPSGRSDERNLQDDETIKRNVAAIKAQMVQVFGSDDFEIVDNADWLSKLKLMEFLRDVGKHFTINSMIKKEMVKERLEKESPISFTEFSYSLLQGYDFLHLNENYSCDLQVGGSDQWSNILAGVDFVRRKKGKDVFALTWPLLINKSTGKKFGKSEGGAVWLDPKKTSPFAFYQFWFNTDDADVEDYLYKMTLLPKLEIERYMDGHRENPSRRFAQSCLASEVTKIVHGDDAAITQGRLSQMLFRGEDLVPLREDEKHILMHDAPHTEVKEGDSLVDVLIASKLASSKREAREFITGGAISVSGVGITDPAFTFGAHDFSNDLALLKRGKRHVCVLVLA